VILLGAILVLGFAKGSYWAVTSIAWSPLDEAQHVGYIESLATGQGIPSVGTDLLSDELMDSIKSSTTSPYRSQPYGASASDPNWGPVRHQYEGMQGPAYYALMTPVYWVSQPFGIERSLWALRLATVALALTAVPLTYLLARRLFPTSPVTWLLAPTILVAFNSLSLGTVTNDALVPALAVAVVLALIRGLDDRDQRSVLLAGALLGLALVTKPTTLFLVPIIGLILVAWVIVVRPTRRLAIGIAGRILIALVVVALPWVAWNLTTYHALSASKQVDLLLDPPVTSGTGLALVRNEVAQIRTTTWNSELTINETYRRVWEWTLGIVVAAGIVVALVRRRRREAVVLASCVVALVLAVVTFEVLARVLSGVLSPTGRYVFGALPFAAIAIAAAIVILAGRRLAVTAVGALLVVAFLVESSMANAYLQLYLRMAHPPALGPVASQTWSDGAVAATGITVDAGCTVHGLAIGFVPPAPPSIEVTSAGTTQTALADPVPETFPDYQFYRLTQPVDGPFEVTLTAEQLVNASSTERSAAVSLPGTDRDPVATPYCDLGDGAEAAAFATSYPNLHPKAITLSMLRTVPNLFVVAAGALVIAGLVLTTRDRRAARQPAPAPTTDAPDGDGPGRRRP
jgi:hypothetical protein